MDAMTSPSSADSTAARHGFYTRFRHRYRLVLWAVFLLSLIHRLSGLGSYPQPHATNDEFFYLWAGMSLLNGEPPRSWSQLEVSKDRILGTYSAPDMAYPIVQPVFDHPPVFQLLAGLTGRIAGAAAFKAELSNPTGSTTLWEASLWKLRLLPMLLYTASFWLLWGWLQLAAGPAAALLAVIFFAFIQHIVVHQRLFIADNAITPLILLVFYTLEKWRRGRTAPGRAATTIAVAIAVAAGCKLVALSAVAAVFAWSSTTLRGKQALRPPLWACAGAAVGVLLTLVFGAAYGFESFLVTMRSQAFRFYDLTGLLDIIRMQPLVHEGGYNLWLISAWLLVPLCMATTSPAQRAVFAAVVGYGVAYIFFAPVEPYGWHLMPFTPFLCAAWGCSLRQVWRSPKTTTSLFVMLLLIISALNPLFESLPILRPTGRYIYMILAVLILFPWGQAFDWRRKLLMRCLIVALTIVGLSQEVTSVISTQMHAMP